MSKELTPKQCKILNKALAILGPKGERWANGELRITEKWAEGTDYFNSKAIQLKPGEYQYCIIGSLIAAEAKVNKKSEEDAFDCYSEDALSPDLTAIANQIIEDNKKQLVANGINVHIGPFDGDYSDESVRIANVLPKLNDRDDGFKNVKKAATKTLKKHCPIQKN